MAHKKIHYNKINKALELRDTFQDEHDIPVSITFDNMNTWNTGYIQVFFDDGVLKINFKSIDFLIIMLEGMQMAEKED